MAIGASIGGLTGTFNAAINGGNLGDVLRGAVVGALQGGISGGILSGWESAGWNLQTLQHVAGHGVLGGAANEALGGKFQDGFLSAAASTAVGDLGFLGYPSDTGMAAVASRTAKASVVGGTASVLGGGKFANGAYTAAFQHLLNSELVKKLPPDKEWRGVRLDDKKGQSFYRNFLLQYWIREFKRST